MYKMMLLILFFTGTVYADSNSTLEGIRSVLTGYYHKFLGNLDDSINCEHTCTSTAISTLKKNSILVISSLKYTKEQHFTPSLNIRGHINLPKFNNKLRITFNKQSSNKLTNKQVDVVNDNTINDTKLRIGLKYQLVTKDKTDIFTRFSFKIRSPFGPYQEFIFKKIFLQHRYDISVSTGASLYYYFSQTYFAKSIQINFIKPLNDTYIISQENDWYANADNEDKKRVTNHLRLFHHLTTKDHLVYWLSYSSLAKSDHTYKQDWQALSVSYIHHINKWFFIQTIPRIIQKKQTHYRNEFEFTLSFGMLLGI